MKAKYSEYDQKSVIEKLQMIPILHMYGKLGNLFGYDSEKPYIPYDLFSRNILEEREELTLRKPIFIIVL